jgi:hypothetical protein
MKVIMINDQQGHLARKSFKLEFVVAWGEFLFYWSHQLIEFEQEKRFRLEKNII